MATAAHVRRPIWRRRSIGPEQLWWFSCRLHRQGWIRSARALKGVNYVVFRAILPPQARVTRDLQLGHMGLGVVVHPNVVVGRRVHIWHNVTLAVDASLASDIRTVIGDDVVIGTGAVILNRGRHDLHIGDGATIGANAVVTRDVGAGQTVVGAPARVVGPTPEDASLPQVVDVHREELRTTHVPRSLGTPPAPASPTS